MNKPSKAFFTTKKLSDGTYEYYVTNEYGKATGFPMSEKEAIKTETIMNKYLGDKTYDNR